jgi:hypothetical protein
MLCSGIVNAKTRGELFDTVKVDKQYVGKSDLYIINDLLYTYLEDPTTGHYLL